MAEENKEVVEETTDQPVEQVTEEKVENKIDESKFESAGDDSVVKVDLSKPPEIKSEEVKEKPAEEEVVVVNEESKPEEVVEDNTPVLQEITEEEISEVEEEVEEAVAEAEATGQPLPENIQKLVDFMDETGGDIQDYVNLNRDISSMDDSEVLDEYYRTTKSHLSPEERNFLLEDTFGIDEEVDDEKAIRKKKIALKEQVAKAKSHLDGQKSKYYEEIKAGSKLTGEQQKAIDFFNRYNKEAEVNKKMAEKQRSQFLDGTKKVFNDKFKGFEYEVGDKRFRFNVKDVESVKENQSDSDVFFKKFLNKNNQIEDTKGFHKALYTAMNSDAVAKHFYEQGKADAMKDSIAKSKNVSMNPRQSHGVVEAGGMKVKVLGDNSSDFKFKIKNRK